MSATALDVYALAFGYMKIIKKTHAGAMHLTNQIVLEIHVQLFSPHSCPAESLEAHISVATCGSISQVSELHTLSCLVELV